MKYRGKEIGIPTLEMVQEYILRENSLFLHKLPTTILKKSCGQHVRVNLIPP